MHCRYLQSVTSSDQCCAVANLTPNTQAYTFVQTTDLANLPGATQGNCFLKFAASAPKAYAQLVSAKLGPMPNSLTLAQG